MIAGCAMILIGTAVANEIFAARFGKSQPLPKKTNRPTSEMPACYQRMKKEKASLGFPAKREFRQRPY
jgi:hypothetical protein